MTTLRITDYHELSGWRPIPMDMPLDCQGDCPCCGEILRGTAMLTPDDISEAINIGVCDRCGYVGYTTRPERSWFDAFYAAEWQDGEAPMPLAENSTHPFMAAIKQIPVGRDTTALEFGCGVGYLLDLTTRQLGWKMLGLEACKHRAKAARDAGFDVLQESIESHQGGPYKVIYSHEVLEHTYDPAQVIKACAGLQEEGGWLALSVPNATLEPTMGQLLFLPHLHSFSQCALHYLLLNNGYLPSVFLSGGTTSLWVIARRRADSPREQVIAKWKKALGEGQEFMPRFWWQKHYDKSGFVSEETWPEFSADIEGPRSVAVEQAERLTNAPIEIQWKGNLCLLVK